MEANWSPDVVLESHKIDRGSVYIARDDLLTGGTKQRAIVPLLQQFMGQGMLEFVYASPFCGYAQLALSSAAKELGAKCHIFCSAFPDSSELPPLAKLALEWGATVTLCSSLANAEVEAEQYSEKSATRFKIPLGFKCDEFDHFLLQAFSEQWKIVQEFLPKPPKALWVPVGSGTFAGVCRKVLTPETQLKCVNVRVLSDSDPRISSLRMAAHTHLFHAHIPFETPCIDSAPVPSNRFYDAKLWKFVYEQADDGDVCWNIAGNGSGNKSSRNLPL